MYASVGEVAFLDVSATWNQALLGITPDPDKVDSRFLRYVLLDMHDDLLRDVRSNTQSNLNDQQTLEARSYAIARELKPLLVNTVVGFIGPEYLYDGKQITRAALEDHFCGKLLGIQMGVDVCYTNHAEADQDDMDNLLTLLGSRGCRSSSRCPARTT